jgi:cellulase/cellobiase CelA1
MTKIFAIVSTIAGVAITTLAAHIAIQSTDNINRMNRINQEIEKFERDHTFKVSGRVHKAETNNKYFDEPDGKKNLIKDLEEEGFYNIEFFYQDNEKMIIDCYTTDDEFKSLIMTDIKPIDEPVVTLSEIGDSLYKE